MARTVLHNPGHRIPIPACAAIHAVGDIVLESGFVGECEVSNVASGPNTLIVEGNFGQVTVPAASTFGAYVYAVGAPPANGLLLTNLASTSVPNLSLTATGNTLIGRITTVPVAGASGALKADIKIFGQAAGLR